MAETLDTPRQEIKLFYCYARKDKALREQLETHLSDLIRQYNLTNWSDREILPGEPWNQTINTHINSADIILLLISPHFLASDHCYREMQRAIERHNEGSCLVIPILLRATYWEGEPFRQLQLLPVDARPITRWRDRDTAFKDVVREISQAIKDLPIHRSKEEWLDLGIDLANNQQYDEALVAFQQAIRLDPNFAKAYNGRGNVLRDLKRYKDALTAFQQAIHLDPNLAIAYNGKGAVLIDLKKKEEALSAFEQALRLRPNFSIALFNKGNVLFLLQRERETIAAMEQAIRLNINDPKQALFRVSYD